MGCRGGKAEQRHIGIDGFIFARLDEIGLIREQLLKPLVFSNPSNYARPLYFAIEELRMPKYITIGYGDHAGYDRTPQDIRQAAHEHDASLKQRGVVMGIAETPVQVRNPNGSGVLTEIGPYLSSDLPIAGFSIMKAQGH
jgi:hypothetical protein